MMMMLTKNPLGFHKSLFIPANRGWRRQCRLCFSEIKKQGIPFRLPDGEVRQKVARRSLEMRVKYLLEEDLKLKGKKVPKRFRNTGKRVVLEHHHLKGRHRGLAFACQLTCAAQALEQAREFTSLAAWETELRNVLHTWGLRVSPEHCYEAE